MRILVMGAGALGTVAGGFLAKAGHEVYAVGRGPVVSAINRDGLFIEGIWGEHHITSIKAVDHLDKLPTVHFDFILVAVKSYDTAEVAVSLKRVVGSGTWVCSYQNGLGNAEIIAREIGLDRVLDARVIFGARVLKPGNVTVTVIAAPTAVGAYAGETGNEAARRLADAMEEAGLPTVSTDRIQTVLWSKVAYNCALNPLSALLNVPYGVLAENAPTRAIMRDVIHELYAVAALMQVPLEPDGADAYLDLFYKHLLPPTAAHYASMREDLMQGRRTEIDALNGAIWRYGQEHDIATPTNAMLTRLVRARELIGDRG